MQQEPASEQIDDPSARPVELETSNLSVRFYERDPKRLVVVFASAGARRDGGFSEEFRATLWPTGASIIFVTDKTVRWYNYEETGRVLEYVARLAAGHRHVAVMGESLGACGAILFTNFAKNIDRVMAFAPQYSITSPFIRFDDRYSYIGEQITEWYVNDFSESPIKDRIIILFGNSLWRDYLHCAMFQAAGFRVGLIDQAPHEIADHIKSTYEPGTLVLLAGLLCDFEKDFSLVSLQRDLSLRWSTRSLHADALSVADPNRARNLKPLGSGNAGLPPALWPLVSAGKPASQSSVSPWSRGKTAQSDAAGALNGVISDSYNFHTDREMFPWWMVDLQEPHDVRQIRIFNRHENAHVAFRCLNFNIQASPDDFHWTVLHWKDDDVYFGGADGNPFVLTLPTSHRCRYVKIVMIGEGVLHFNQVQIFGSRSPVAVA